MSKRKRASLGKTPSDAGNPPAEDSTDDASVKEDMVHVTPDLLAGSPDIFAASKGSGSPGLEPSAEGTGPGETSAEATPAEQPAAAAPGAGEPPVDNPPAESDTVSDLTPEPAGPDEPVSAPPPPPAPFVHAAPHPAPARRGGSSAALGIVLVVVGIFALVVVVSGVDLTQYGWPLFVIIPGLTLLVVGFFGVGAVATIPGGIVTVLGLVLAYQSSTGDWPSWAYAWALVLPGGVGLGMYLQALHDRDQHSLRTGRSLMFIGVLIFIIGFVFFESILGISGRDYGIVGKAALPVLLIIIGLILLVRSVQRARRA